jgi:hypothetical protein
MSIACPGTKQSFKINSRSMSTSSSLPNVGDTARLVFSFTALYTGPAHMHLNFPDQVVPFDRATGEIERDSIIHVDSGTVYSDSISLKLSAYGYSLVQFEVGLDSGISASMRIAQGASDYVGIEHSSASFHVRYSTDHTNAYDTIHSDAQALGSATLNISCKVRYADIDQSSALKGGLWSAVGARLPPSCFHK